MKRSILKICLFLIISIQFACAQSLKEKYVIFTFEYINNKSPHGTQIYYWIQSLDSLKQQHSQLDKLLLSGYSVSELQDCCSKKAVNPYTSVSSNTNVYDFDKKYYKAIDTLSIIIKNNRRRIALKQKKYGQSKDEMTRIYITPVEGIFCQSKFIPIRDGEMLYKGLISVPSSSFSFYKKFWKDKEYDSVREFDYSKFVYDILPPNHVKQ